MKRSSVWHMPRLVEFREKARVYLARRREAAIARGDCDRCCTRPRLLDHAQCAKCIEKRRTRERAQVEQQNEYVPLDEILERPRVRILRQLRHHDWTTPVELLDVLDVPGKSERNRYGAALAGAVTCGLIERRDLYSTAEYRITMRGREFLRREINSYEQRLGEGVAA